jgi:hypothetical protein
LRTFRRRSKQAGCVNISESSEERGPAEGRGRKGKRPGATEGSMFIIPYGAPEGYEWFVALVVLVCLYFAVRNFMRARR